MTRTIIGPATRQVRRNRRVLDLIFRTRDDAHPRYTVLLDRREQDHVVNTYDIRPNLRQYLWQIALRVSRTVNYGRPAVLDVVVDLLISGLVEIRQVPVYKLLPKAGHLID